MVSIKDGQGGWRGVPPCFHTVLMARGGDGGARTVSERRFGSRSSGEGGGTCGHGCSGTGRGERTAGRPWLACVSGGGVQVCVDEEESATNATGVERTVLRTSSVEKMPRAACASPAATRTRRCRVCGPDGYPSGSGLGPRLPSCPSSTKRGKWSAPRRIMFMMRHHVSRPPSRRALRVIPLSRERSGIRPRRAGRRAGRRTVEAQGGRRYLDSASLSLDLYVALLRRACWTGTRRVRQSRGVAARAPGSRPSLSEPDSRASRVPSRLASRALRAPAQKSCGAIQHPPGRVHSPVPPMT